MSGNGAEGEGFTVPLRLRIEGEHAARTLLTVVLIIEKNIISSRRAIKEKQLRKGKRPAYEKSSTGTLSANISHSGILPCVADGREGKKREGKEGKPLFGPTPPPEKRLRQALVGRKTEEKGGTSSAPYSATNEEKVKKESHQTDCFFLLLLFGRRGKRHALYRMARHHTLHLPKGRGTDTSSRSLPIGRHQVLSSLARTSIMTRGIRYVLLFAQGKREEKEP